jgi:rhamnosyltransferase
MGCNYFHEALHRPAINESTPFRCVERKTLITSGTLMWSKLPETLGWFREDYFIDSVDHEFSLRLRKQGYRLWMSTQVLMRHSIGRTSTFHRPTLFKIPEHSALRKYYITRNCLVTVFNYCRQEPLWCLRQFARLSIEFLSIILYEQTRRQKIAAVGLGIGHALKGTMGELAQNAWIKKEHNARS